MSDDLPGLLAMQAPTADRPLQGLTVLVVEDSRFASEAVRLLCLRSGARIRRADCLMAAHKHLRAFRPSVVIIDLGLPDGSGAELILELSKSPQRVPVILAMSGDAGAEMTARAAGADGFIEKPISSLGAFQTAILEHLPDAAQPRGLRTISNECISPDPLALQDDLAHVADILTTAQGPDMLDYVAQFLGGLGRSSGDAEMEEAAHTLAKHREDGEPWGQDAARIAGLVHNRLQDRQVI